MKMGVSSSLNDCVRKAGPFGSMVVVQMISAGYIVMSKIIVVEGIISPVFLFYQFLLGTVFMAVFAFIFERKSRPPLTLPILCWIFLMAFLGITFMQNMMVACLYFITSTVEAAVLNMLPIFTYAVSIMMRQEKLELSTCWGKGKILGTLLSVSGALTIMLWRVPSTLDETSTTSPGGWILGSIMVVVGVFAFSSWISLLGPMTRLYPAEFSLTAIMLFFAMLQTGLIAVVVTHKSEQWRLMWNMELLNIFIGGLLNGAVSNFLMTWCSGIKGPVFVASFPPLGMVFTTILETTFLHKSLHIGSIAGSIMIMVGLYAYLWSKSKEEASCPIDEDYESLQATAVP